MTNLYAISQNIQNLPDNSLLQEINRPSGRVPISMVYSEIERRRQMRQAASPKPDMPKGIEALGLAEGGMVYSGMSDQMLLDYYLRTRDPNAIAEYKNRQSPEYAAGDRQLGGDTLTDLSESSAPGTRDAARWEMNRRQGIEGVLPKQDLAPAYSKRGQESAVQMQSGRISPVPGQQDDPISEMIRDLLSSGKLRDWGGKYTGPTAGASPTVADQAVVEGPREARTKDDTGMTPMAEGLPKGVEDITGGEASPARSAKTGRGRAAGPPGGGTTSDASLKALLDLNKSSVDAYKAAMDRLNSAVQFSDPYAKALENAQARDPQSQLWLAGLAAAQGLLGSHGNFGQGLSAGIQGALPVLGDIERQKRERDDAINQLLIGQGQYQNENQKFNLGRGDQAAQLGIAQLQNNQNYGLQLARMAMAEKELGMKGPYYQAMANYYNAGGGRGGGGLGSLMRGYAKVSPSDLMKEGGLSMKDALSVGLVTPEQAAKDPEGFVPITPGDAVRIANLLNRMSMIQWMGSDEAPPEDPAGSISEEE